jgi:hypothetical protein
MKIVEIQNQTLEQYRTYNSNFSLPEKVDGITVAFDDDGKIIDWEAYDSKDEEIKLHFQVCLPDCYPDIKKLFQDAYFKCKPRRSVIYPKTISSLFTY